MRIRFEYDALIESVVLIPEDFAILEWKNFIRIISDYSSSSIQEGNQLKFPFRVFIGIRKEIAKYVRNHGINCVYSEKFREVLQSVNSRSYPTALKAAEFTEDAVQKKLDAAGFTRRLTTNQMNIAEGQNYGRST